MTLLAVNWFTFHEHVLPVVVPSPENSCTWWWSPLPTRGIRKENGMYSWRRVVLPGSPSCTVVVQLALSAEREKGPPSCTAELQSGSPSCTTVLWRDDHHWVNRFMECEPVHSVRSHMRFWWFEGLMIWWSVGRMIWCPEGLMVWWNNDMMFQWSDLIFWCFKGLIWCSDDLNNWLYDGQMIW